MPDYSDLDRPPLRVAALRRALVVPGGLYRAVEVVEATGSTNADVVARARAGEAEGLVLAAEAQSAGRGRLGRTWTAPARAALTFSVLLRPGAAVPAARWGWLPLLAGVAVVDGLRRVAGVEPELKWPNDVLLGGGKLGGVLTERVDGAAVVGVGLNVSLRRDELPVPTATSLAVAGAPGLDRDPLLRAVLRALADRYAAWRADGGDPAAVLAPAYRSLCATVGREVAVQLPGGQRLHGRALDVDTDGRLVVAAAAGTTSVAAGDVIHVR